MNSSLSVLIVEDDRPVRSLISTALQSRSYRIDTAASGNEALVRLTGSCPDILILDLGLPDMDGVDIIAKVREWSQLPIIVVSARSADKDKILSLDAGADDYLTKPFSVDELLARIRVAARRLQFLHETSSSDIPVFNNGGLTIDYRSACVTVDEKEVHLTPIEYKLLCLLAKNIGRVLTHNVILKEVWNNTQGNDTQSLRVYMASLRSKVEIPLGAKIIQTHIGIGYQMIRL